MIIELSPNDTSLRTDTLALSREYKEKHSLFEPGCFEGCRDKRLTFIGHTSTRVYGDDHLSPAQFVDRLIALGLPKNVQIIDLIGCEIGMVRGGKKSYAQRVADILYARGYFIRINAFTSMEMKEGKGMLVTARGNVEVVNNPSMYAQAVKLASDEERSAWLEVERAEQAHIDRQQKMEKARGLQSADISTMTLEEKLKHLASTITDDLIDDIIKEEHTRRKAFSSTIRKELLPEKYEVKVIQKEGNVREILDKNSRYHLWPTSRVTAPIEVHGSSFHSIEGIELVDYRKLRR